MSRFNEKRFSTPPSLPLSLLFSSAAKESPIFCIAHFSLSPSALFILPSLLIPPFLLSVLSHDQLVGLLVTVLSCFRRTPFLGHSSSVIYNLLRPLTHWKRFTIPSWNKSTISKKCLEGNSPIRNHSNVSSLFRAFTPGFLDPKFVVRTTILHCINRVF